VAITDNPHTVYSALNPAGAVRGVSEVQSMVNRGLTMLNDRDVRVPMLAEATPSVENGLWTLFPDGKMQTTWTLRPGVQWHDGAPFTTADVLFTAQIARDTELPVLSATAFRFVESLEAIDARTLTVQWRQPYVDADALLGTTAQSVARHLLEPSYLQSKQDFTQFPTGVSSSSATGRSRSRPGSAAATWSWWPTKRSCWVGPRLDEVEVRFFTDANTLVASTLSDAIDITMGRGISLDQAVQLRDQWLDGKLDLALSGWLVVFPQMIEPTPPQIGDVRFRRALLRSSTVRSWSIH